MIMDFSGYGVWLYRNNAGYELFIVNPTADGPRIYNVR